MIVRLQHICCSFFLFIKPIYDILYLAHIVKILYMKRTLINVVKAIRVQTKAPMKKYPGKII